MTVPPPPPSKPAPQARLSGLAITSMVLGILSFCLTIITAIPAIVLGIIALVQIKRDPQRHGGKGMAITGIVTGALGGLMLALLLPSLAIAREQARRLNCQANLRHISLAMAAYAEDNASCYPVVAAPSAAWSYDPRTSVPGTHTDAGDAMLEASRGVAGNPLASPWLLVLDGRIQRRALICPSDSYCGAPTPAIDAWRCYTLVPAADSVSYSIDYPWTFGETGTTRQGWRSSNDNRQPVLSDMAPLPGTVEPAAGGTANSPNHGGRGQNVAFADRHVEWMTNGTLTGGKGGPDELFTSGNPSAAPTPGHVTPPADPYDAVMVPMRNGRTGDVE